MNDQSNEVTEIDVTAAPLKSMVPLFGVSKLLSTFPIYRTISLHYYQMLWKIRTGLLQPGALWHNRQQLSPYNGLKNVSTEMQKVKTSRIPLVKLKQPKPR